VAPEQVLLEHLYDAGGRVTFHLVAADTHLLAALERSGDVTCTPMGERRDGDHVYHAVSTSLTDGGRRRVEDLRAGSGGGLGTP
jgi:hypothetical protein